MISFLLAACQTEPEPLPITEIGNPERILGVGAAALPPDTAPASEVRRAWAALGETKFVLDEQLAGEHELEWETPELVADLSAGPVEIDFRSPDAVYNRVTLRPRTGRDLPADAPSELRDNSFVVEGSRGDGVPFLLLSETEEHIELVGSFTLERAQKRLALGFAIDSWLSDADLDSASVEGGQITIDRDHNEALLASFEAALPSSITLVEDLDGDGQAGDTDLVLLE